MTHEEWIKRFEKVLEDNGIPVKTTEFLPRVESHTFPSDLLTRYDKPKLEEPTKKK